MRRNRLFLLVALLPTLSAVQAQTSYEAAELLDTDLSGTARYVGMGGAMSALGADISTMGTNPAGTALFRSYDLSMSFGGNWVTQRMRSNSGLNRSFESFGTFDNVGIVMANKLSNDNMLRFVNWGFNYRNVKRFGGKMGMSADLAGLSQTWQMGAQAWDNWEYVDYTNFDPASSNNFFDNNYYVNPNIGWLTLLGADANLMGLFAYQDEEGNLLYDENGNVKEDFWYRGGNACDYTEHISGGINAYDFNLSFNLLDAVYLGVTFTTYNVDRNLYSSYTEYFNGGDYTLENFYTTTGSGYDFKFGAILRPFEESSFRIGVSATTPTVYTLRDYNSAIVSSTISFYDQTTAEEWTESFYMDTQSNDAFGVDCYTDYTMITPAKVNVSLGGTIGTSLALGAEYEYSNYGATRLYYDNGNENVVMNNHTAENFTGQHTFRVGAEKMFAGSFYTRLGYNLITGGYGANAWKMIPITSVQTNTAYKNILSTSNYSCGIGYRGDSFYADAALLYSSQSANFYPFDDVELEATKLNRQYLKGMFTIGFRF